MDIKETFLKLTSRTYPHGTESELMHLLHDELETDEFGNRFIKIGDNPSCMFTSHLDTATSANATINHVIEGDIIKTDNKTILGADDKAGVTIMLYMIENKIPGLYYFFLGEEVGCVGSKKLSTKHKESKIEHITKVISFDRRGYDSVISYQASSRCCSDTFAKALSEELNKAETTFNYKPDPTGVYTDSAQFTRIYPECTNISVGYKNEHNFAEQQNIAHLIILAEACLSVDWENLPTERDPTKYEYNYSRYGYGYGDYEGYGYDNYEWGGTNRYVSNYKPTEDTETVYFMDPTYCYVSSIKLKKHSNKLVSTDLCEERIYDERVLILNLLDELEVNYEIVDWNGTELSVEHTESGGGHTTKCSREEIAEFLPDLDFWKKAVEAYSDEIYNSF